MIPAKYDLTIVRGTSGPTQGLIVRLKSKDAQGNLTNIPFDDVRLSIYQRTTKLLRPSLSEGGLTVSNATEAEITWAPSADDTRLIPEGKKSRYELEVRNAGLEVVYMIGDITGMCDINDDIDEAS